MIVKGILKFRIQCEVMNMFVLMVLVCMLVLYIISSDVVMIVL